MTAATPDRRPWHRGVDRRAIADASLRILDEDGLDALTMRAVASAVGVEAASLYAHVTGKADLTDAVLDVVLDGVALPEPTGDRRADLVAGFAAYRRALLAHPVVVPLVAQRTSMSPSQVRLVERSLELLEAAGLSTRAAVDTHVTLLGFTLGFVIQEAGRSASAPGALLEASPRLRRALATLREREVDDRFEVGIGLILDGARVGNGRSRTRRGAASDRNG